MKKKYPELKALKGRLVERGETYRGLSVKTGIGLNTLSNKLNGHAIFRLDEVAVLCEVLQIDSHEIGKFFLTQSCETQRRKGE